MEMTMTNQNANQTFGDNMNNEMQKRRARQLSDVPYSEAPPFPFAMLIEISNICNHKCTFCAYSKMTRPHKTMDPVFFKRVMREAYELGAREVGLHSGTEPFACKHLVSFIEISKEIGFEYVYITTNGSIPTEKKLQDAIDAGVDSIKFSINAGDAETYEKIHGKPHFDKVIRNVRFANEYRKTMNKKLYLGVSFIEVVENVATLDAMKALVAPLVDEIFTLGASNQSGQMPGEHMSLLPEICSIPFNQLNITVEGYLRGCCTDYQNMLVLEDLNEMSLDKAWTGMHARELRRMHLENRLEGTLCHTCITGCSSKIKSTRPDLADWGQI